MDSNINVSDLSQDDLSGLARTIKGFMDFCQTFHGDEEAAVSLWLPVLVRFQPVLRHYRDDIIGRCLALAYDDRELTKMSQLHGFGLYMQAGDHPGDRDSTLGSYRDDGSYLALQVYDHLKELAR